MIEIKNVTKIYGGKNKAVDGLSITIPTGDDTNDDRCSNTG